MPAPRRSAKRPGSRGDKRPSGLPRGPQSLSITTLGAQGDGVGRWGETPVYVPGALPGETVSVHLTGKRGDGITATLDSVLVAAPERQSPPCPVFDLCGGCALQHLDTAAEERWKQDWIGAALKSRGLSTESLRPMVRIPAGTRQRATFAWRRLKDRVVLGFNARASHQIVDLPGCLVLDPVLSALIPDLRLLIGSVAPTGSTGDLSVTLSDTGADLWIDLPDYPGLTVLEALSDWASSRAVARLGVRVDGVDHPLVTVSEPILSLGGTVVALPRRSFLQPSRSGADALLAEVQAALDGVDGAVADLFCGLGTFSLPLSDRFAVQAYDSEATAIASLRQAARQDSRRVTADVRDLFRDPLEGKELAGYGAVVLDPPRAGALAQCQALSRVTAAQPPGRVVMVSCNPATFARDARCLVDAGYRLVSLVPVDQFVWSSHLELVARFDR